MTKLLISGACGRMGRLLSQEAQGRGFEVSCGVDPLAEKVAGFPVFPSFDKVTEESDLLIDFSTPKTLYKLLDFAVHHALPCVLGATGYTSKDLVRIQAASAAIPIFQSPNMSRGVYVLKQLAAEAARLLPDFDIEIIEKHHQQKADSPSGTAYSLLANVSGAETVPVFGRKGDETKRDRREIGVHAIRGGTVAGEHEVGYYGNHEVITLTHSAQSRIVFVSGALAAAEWLLKMPPGLYGMQDFFGAD